MIDKQHFKRTACAFILLLATSCVICQAAGVSPPLNSSVGGPALPGSVPTLAATPPWDEPQTVERLLALPAEIPIRRRLLPVQGRPLYLAYAEGLRNTVDLGLYRSLGFNTLLVDVPWTAEMSWDSTDKLLRSAHRLGLAAIIQLHPGQPPATLKLRVDSANQDYVKAASQYLQTSAKHFQTLPEVDALMLENDSEQHGQTDDDGFRAFLERKYPDLAAINQDWGSTFENVNQINMAGCMETSLQQFDGMSVPGLLVGEYREEAYQNLLDLWTNVLQAADPVHPLFCGRQDSPRSMIETPRACAGLVVSNKAGDPLPVDIARRGGQFITIVSPTAADSQNFQSLRDLLTQSLIHGAGGVAFPSWQGISFDRDLQTSLKPLLRELSASAQKLHTPLASAAVVYEPLSPGVPEGGLDAPYGYVPGPADQEPGLLLNTLAHGSSYGLTDVLSIEDVSTPLLAHYRTLFLPSAYRVPPEAIQALADFVQNGGIIVADLGFDLDDIHFLYQPWLTPVASLFGILGTRPIQFGALEYPVHEQNFEPPGLAVWTPIAPRLDTFPDLNEAAIRQFAAHPSSFSGPRGFAQPVPGAETVVFGLNPPSRTPDILSGVFCRRLGQGATIFATFRLWSTWGPDDGLFVLFHGDLLQRDANLYLDSGIDKPSSIQFSSTPDHGFQLMQTGAGTTVATVHIDEEQALLRQGCIIQTLPTDPPCAEGYVSLQPHHPTACDAAPIRVEAQNGSVTAALDEYDAAQIRLKMCGTGSTVRVEGGVLHVVPAGSGDATLTIRDGTYRIAPGSKHQALVKDLRPPNQINRIHLEASQDGILTLPGRYVASSITITPETAATG